ncbi:hypothetical protein [Parahaliea mediterranea]|uniref:hypothetical protein n=1 Tax=Parahaliea mediterranea TaxID=651086 RepID=UPI000E2F662E|nr:hypothetical protein [Parahaliea mediterranea]
MRAALTAVLALAPALLLLAACGGTATRPSPQYAPPVQAAEWPAPVGSVVLRRQAPMDDAAALDIGLAVFDPGLAEDVTSHGTRGIFPEIRRAEVRYLPVLLRQALVDAGAWGVVRVLPEADDSAELQISATILHSDGLRLALAVNARDATGRVWLQRVYTDVTGPGDYPVPAGADPFADLYRQIANDLLAVRQGLSSAEVRAIAQVGELRYAQSLAPDAFAGYLVADEAGHLRVQRLPAEGDPMMARVQRLRDQEHRFIDTVDEQYVDLVDDMRPTYDLWRQYGREQAEYMQGYQQRLQDRDSAGRRGSFAAMQQTYNTFRWSKVQQQDLRELAQGFDNEVSPTVLDVSGRVFRLSGSLESQYDEWRGILRQIFALETGLGLAPEGQ